LALIACGVTGWLLRPLRLSRERSVGLDLRRHDLLRRSWALLDLL
jgi:hypothetical protein